MDSKIDIIFYKGKSKFVAPSYRMIANSDNEQDREYVPLIAIPTTPPAWATRSTPQKVVPSVVTAPQSDEERTLSDGLFGSTSGSKG